MQIGYVSLGKLALPVALAAEHYGGHEVIGTDISDQVCQNVRNRHIPYREIGAQELLDKSNISLGTVDDVVREAEIVFTAIQTPNSPQFEGITRVPYERENFDYTWLIDGVKQVVEAAEKQHKHTTLAVISTVLPGTMEKHIKPLLGDYVRLAYNPYYIAMGTTIPDFINPEYVLLGVDDPDAADLVESFYATIHDRPILRMSVASAELSKVSYNTAITQKICMINTIMEICHKTGADVDDVTRALTMATDRVISPKYLNGGMGDSGGCHPRDLIALSWLARDLDLSFDWYEVMAQSREAQTDWLADLFQDAMDSTGFPGVVLGRAYKPETNLVVGSAALLLLNLLKERDLEVDSFDPHVDEGEPPLAEPAVFFIATNHSEFVDYVFPAGSIVLDPWGYIPDQEGVHVNRIGRKSELRRDEPRSPN